MRKVWIIPFALVLFLFSCQKQKEELYTIGIFQVNEAPHLNEARKGFVHAFEEAGFYDGMNIRLLARNGKGDIAEVHKIAQNLIREDVDMICALSTPCLQAVLNVSPKVPIIFTSVANPYRAGVGRSPRDHLSNVTGIASTGPIKEALSFIKEVMPQVKRLGTLWTPSEINSEYYLEISRKTAQSWKAAMDKGNDKVVLLCDAKLRSPLAVMLSRTVPMLPVVAYDEIVLGTEVEPLETISIQQNDSIQQKKRELVGASG